MTFRQIGFSLLFLLGASSVAACDYTRAKYVYTSDSTVTATFEKLPHVTGLLSDVAMVIEREGKPSFWFVFDAGSSVTSRMSETTSVGSNAWRVGAGRHRSLSSLPFYAWSADYRLVNSLPQSNKEAPDILFVPDLDETLRHLPDVQFNLGQGFFKMMRCN